MKVIDLRLDLKWLRPKPLWCCSQRVVGEDVDGEEEDAEAEVEGKDEDVDNNGDDGGDESNKGREDEKDEEKESESDNGGEERSVREGGSLVGDKEDEKDCDGDWDFVVEIEGEVVGSKEAGIVVEIGQAIALLASLEAGWDCKVIEKDCECGGGSPRQRVVDALIVTQEVEHRCSFC
ncbi:hypothetical protein BGZ80_005364 [Entomortierella chlamydospora]|uniref:Uncharacterized protein n=1 Tax=Entomortierella chlamydospora TaxID=101097 RepID=A0A9P6N0V6_9FUNG|nr:hypothetical protein BGZ80_005364 [Entomortierella chlamydospora]